MQMLVIGIHTFTLISIIHRKQFNAYTLTFHAFQVTLLAKFKEKSSRNHFKTHFKLSSHQS